MNRLTHRLYFDDAYLTAFDATVLDVQQRADGPWLRLDRSAFYPTSGGQPHAIGTLTGPTGTAQVLDVLADDAGMVWHRVDVPLPVGKAVHGQIDWARRHDHMQQHGGEHILAGCVWALHQGYTHGLHIGADNSTIDVTMPDGRTRLTEQEMAELEDLANRRVQQDAVIRAWFPDEQEMATLPLRKDPAVEGHVRVIAVGDFEYCACGGTHPHRSGEIGLIKVLSTAPARGKMRVTFLCGMRALRHYRQVLLSANQAGSLLSTPAEGLAQAVERLKVEQATIREQVQALRMQAAEHTADALLQAAQPLPDGGRLCRANLPLMDIEGMKAVASRLIAQEDVIALLSAPVADGQVMLFARGRAMPQDMAALLRQSGARGGGKPDWAQGSAKEDGVLESAAATLTSLR